MDKQCNADTQKKLIDYINAGAKLILVGRMCEEDFDQTPCTQLRNALRINTITRVKPFTPGAIHAFQYRDIPVSFIETYTGQFDEVFARSENGEIVGSINSLGKGKVLLFGAAMTANTLEDLDVVNQMADRMDCPSLFTMSDWADCRISRGENGSFLFINNYQDDPIETKLKVHQASLFDVTQSIYQLAEVPSCRSTGSTTRV